MQLYPPSFFDDAANGYRHIKTVPLTSSMGAEIRGVNIATITDAQFEEVRAALFRYKMIYFRDQVVSQVASDLAASLLPGGVLAVGVSESLIRFDTPLVCEELGGVFLYRKKVLP